VCGKHGEKIPEYSLNAQLFSQGGLRH